MDATTSGWVSLDGFAPVLAQWDTTRRWNGWLCPSIDAWAVVKVLDAINAESGEPIYLYDWTEEGYLMLVDLQDDDGGIEFMQPDADGLYPLGALAWIGSEEQRVCGTFRPSSPATVRRSPAMVSPTSPSLPWMRPSGARPRGGRLYEVQFMDGRWMLAREADLQPTQA